MQEMVYIILLYRAIEEEMDEKSQETHWTSEKPWSERRIPVARNVI